MPPDAHDRAMLAKRQRRASPRVLLVAAIALVLAGGATALAVSLACGSGSARTEPTVAGGAPDGALPGAAEVRRLLARVPQRQNVLGSANAPLRIVEYVDLQCPYCAEFERTVVPSLVQRYVRTGKASLELRLLAFIGPDSQRGRAAAIAAGGQGKLFHLVQLLYANQGAENSGWLSDDLLQAAVAGIPTLQLSRLLRDRDSVAAAQAGARFDAQAAAAGVQATPTIMVGSRGGPLSPVALATPHDLAAVSAALDAIT
jgi:protein-disulfide isomerase